MNVHTCRSLVFLALTLLLPGAAGAQHFPSEQDLTELIRSRVEEDRAVGIVVGVLEAESHYRSATDADPESGRAFYNLGVALDDQGLQAGAIEAYQAALRLDENLAVAHFNLSRLFEAEGRRPDALRHLAEHKRLIERGGLEA